MVRLRLAVQVVAPPTSSLTVSGALPRAHVGDADVGCVVEGEPAGEDEYDGGDDLDGDAHEVGVAADVDHRHDDADQDEEGDAEVGHQQQRHQHDGGEGQGEVAEQLLRYYL